MEVTAVGTGPGVLLVHGVGVGPAAMAPLADALAGAGHRAVIVHRPGYGRAARSQRGSLAEQVDALAELLDGTGPGAAVGISGGATLLLRAAVEGRSAVPLVVHEPLVGPTAPALHARIAAAAARLAVAPGPDAVVAFVTGLVGEGTWQALPAAERAGVRARAAVVVAEVAAFAAWAPSEDDLAGCRKGPPLVVSVGACSPGERAAAAEVLVGVAGAAAEVVPGAGHLAQVDAPGAMAGTVLAALHRWAA